jgi:hypothetical protein
LRRLLSLDPAERPGTEEILQVFKSPSKFDDITGYAAPSGLEDLGSRISRADTPSPAPTMHSRKNSRATFVRPGSSTLAASFEPARDPSPSKQRPTSSSSSGRSMPRESSVMLRPRAVKPDVLPASLSRPTSPRLMLPPPPPHLTLAARTLHALSHPPVLALVKILLFVAKVVSVSSPCFPLAPSPRVAWPLLCLALLDFWSGVVDEEHGEGYWGTVGLAVVHMVVVGAMAKWGGGLCASPSWSEL